MSRQVCGQCFSLDDAGCHVSTRDHGTGTGAALKGGHFSHQVSGDPDGQQHRVTVFRVGLDLDHALGEQQHVPAAVPLPQQGAVGRIGHDSAQLQQVSATAFRQSAEQGGFRPASCWNLALSHADVLLRLRPEFPVCTSTWCREMAEAGT